MNKLPFTLLSLSLLLTPLMATAQDPAPSVPPEHGAGAQATTAAPSQTRQPDVPTDAAPVAQDGTQAETDLGSKIEALEVKVAGLEESASSTEATVGSLKKIKVSGYIQGRYERSEASFNGLKSDGKTPANADRFLVRLARIKTVYEGRNAEYLLQIDATGDGVTLKDAEATFVDTWTPFELRLTVGQFKVPFGHELLQSSAAREMPERSAIVRAYFDGERDRGLRVTASWKALRLAVALINGNGVKDTSVYKGTALYGTQDPNKFKDFAGRLGIDFGTVVGGVSAYLGRGPMATTVTSGSSPTDAATVTYDNMRRTRLGADVQAYIDVPEVGGLALKGELIWGSEKAINWNDIATDLGKNVKKLGWIVTAVQNVGDYVGVVVRLDQVDPNTAKDGDKVTTVGGGVLVYASSNLKASLIYQHPMEEGKKAKDDLLTAQLQARF